MLAQPIDDNVLRGATGLHRDTVRRLVVDKLMTPLETPRGRGIRRQWSLGDFRRAALISAFIQIGAAATWATPIVHELMDDLLEAIANEKHGPGLITVYHSIYAFLEYPEGDMPRINEWGMETGWRNNRMLCTFLQKKPTSWRGFPDQAFQLMQLRDDPKSVWHQMDEEERAYYTKLAEIGEQAHAAAEVFECAIMIHASRTIRSAEGRAAKLQQKENAA